MIYVDDYTPAGVEPCTTVWAVTAGHYDCREEQPHWVPETYTLVCVLVGDYRYSPDELVRLGGSLEQYEQNLRDALADGATCESAPVAMGVAAE